MHNLQNAAIEEHKKEYEALIKEMKAENSIEILKLIIKNSENEEIKIKTILLYISAVNNKRGEKYDLNAISQLIFRAKIENASVLLTILENFHKSISEEVRNELAVKLKEMDFDTKLLVQLLNSNNSNVKSTVISLLCKTNTELFIRECMKDLEKSTKIAKNVALVFAALDVSYFRNYRNYLPLLQMDSHHLRSLFVEIAEKLIIGFKSSENYEVISELTSIIVERLLDTNFLVRTRALCSLLALFRNAAVLNEQKSDILEKVVMRINDKTVFVRKKALSILSQIILNYSCTQSSRNDAICLLMEKAVEEVANLLSCNFKTDAEEIFTFLKIAYLHKVKNSKKGMEKMLTFIYQEEFKPIVIAVFKEIINKRENILFEFAGNKAFEDSLQFLDIDPKSLLVNLSQLKNVNESIYVLKHLKNFRISESTALKFLEYATEIVFSSKDVSSLRCNVEMYNNVLVVLLRIKTRLEPDSCVFELITKNLVKMVFYEHNLIDNTIKVFYKISYNPETNAIKLIRSFVKAKSTLKILDAIGCISMNQYLFLELVEKRLKGEIFGNTSFGLNESIGEKTENPQEKRLKRNSLANSKSFNFRDLQKAMKEQNEEEISDYFSFLRETQLLFSHAGFLGQFMNFLVEKCWESKNIPIKQVALISLCKCMLISSQMFHKHYKSLYLHVLLDKDEDSTIRNSLIVFLHDFIIYYNSYIDYKMVFHLVSDSTLKMNAVLLIYNLIHKNVIRIQGYSPLLMQHAEDHQISPVIKALIKTISDSKTSANILNIIFYESFVSTDVSVATIRFICGFLTTSVSRQKLFEKCERHFNEKENQLLKEKMEVICEEFNIENK
ncbi:hypothetical protein NUSPORA_00319 [Nucleospora cyclopteri]